MTLDLIIILLPLCICIAICTFTESFALILSVHHHNYSMKKEGQVPFIDKEMKSEDNSMTCSMSLSNLVVKAELDFLAPDSDTDYVSLCNVDLEHHKM